MAAPITIALMGTPKGKGRPRFRRATGTTYTPETTRKYEAALRAEAEKVMAGAKPLTGPLDVTVLAQFAPPASWPKKRREAALRREILPTVKPDGDNLQKMLDAFNGVVWVDDAQVVTSTIRKRYGSQSLLLVQVSETAIA